MKSICAACGKDIRTSYAEPEEIGLCGSCIPLSIKEGVVYIDYMGAKLLMNPTADQAFGVEANVIAIRNWINGRDRTPTQRNMPVAEIEVCKLHYYGIEECTCR